MLSCPNMAWMARRLAPPSKRWVANECRNVWGLMLFFSPMRSANSFIIWNTMMREMFFPNRLMNTKSSYSGVFGFYFGIAALYEIILQFVNGAGRDRHEALLASLAFHLDEAFVQIEVG